MEEQLISFETAKLAEDKGFDIEVLNFYTKPRSKMFGIDEHYRYYPIVNKKGKVYTIGKEAALNLKNVIYAPTQSLLQRWLREKHNIHISVWYSIVENNYNCDIYLGKDTIQEERHFYRDSYEQALEKALQEALKLIENE